MPVARFAHSLHTQAATVTVSLGGPFALVYRTDLMPGYAPARSARIGLTGDTVPKGLRALRAATSIDGFATWTDYPAEPHQSHRIVAPEPSDVTLRVEYTFKDGPAVNERKVGLGIRDPRANLLGGALLVGQPLVDRTRIVPAIGPDMATHSDDAGRRIGHAAGTLHVVEGDQVVGIHDALTGRLLWRTDPETGSLSGPDGSVLEIERTGEQVHLTLGDYRTSLTLHDGSLRSVDTPQGSIELELDAGGLLTRLVDGPLERRLSYDADGRLSDIESTDGHIVLTREELPDGFRVSAADGLRIDESLEVRHTADGQRHTRRCCGMGATVSEVDGDTTTVTRPDGTTVMRTPIADGTESTTTLPSGSTRRWRTHTERVDGAHTTRLDNDGQTWTTTVADDGRTVTTRTPGGRQSTTTFDESERITGVDSADGTRQRFDWSGPGSFTVEGSAGRIEVEDQPNGSRTLRSAVGEVQLAQLTDGVRLRTASGVELETTTEGAATSVQVNGRPYLTRTKGDDGSTELRHGDALLARIQLDGTVAQASSEESLRVETDLADRPLLASGQGVERSFEWEYGRLSIADAHGQRTRFTWDGAELRAITAPGHAGEALRIDRHNSGALAAVEILGERFDVASTDGIITELGPLSMQLDERWTRPVQLSVGHLDEHLAYDPLGRLTERRIEVDGRTVFTHSLERDDAARIRRQTVTAGTTIDSTYRYEHDALAEVAGTDPIALTHDADDRLVGLGSTRITLDPVGTPTAIDGQPVELTSGRRIAAATLEGVATTFEYNAAGEMTAITADGRRTDIVRDALGRPIEIRHPDTTRRLVWDHGGPLALLDESGAVLERYVRPPGQRLPQLIIRDDAVHRLVTDQLGTPLALIDTTTGDVEQHRFSAYGLPQDVPTGSVFGYGGGIVLHHQPSVVDMGARSYLPSIGRWAQWDPLLERGGGTDLYGYAANDPVNRHDPTGTIVEYCYGSTDWVDILPHGWLKTGAGERGQAPGKYLPWMTEWKDEGNRSAKDGASCVEVPFVDEDCVNRLTEPGTYIGPYGEPIMTSPFPVMVPRMCHVVAAEVLAECALEATKTSAIQLQTPALLPSPILPTAEQCCGPGGSGSTFEDFTSLPDLGYTPLAAPPEIDYTPNPSADGSGGSMGNHDGIEYPPGT